MTEIGEEIGGRSPAAIMQWLHGETRPNSEMRAHLWSAYRIPPTTWDVRVFAPDAPDASAPPSAPLAPSAPPAPAPPATRPTTLEACLAVLDDIRAARGTPNLLASERIKLADSETRILALRAKLEREAERTEDRIVREHPEWLRLKRLIVRTLSAHPAALKDLAAALGDSDTPADGAA